MCGVRGRGEEVAGRGRGAGTCHAEYAGAEYASAEFGAGPDAQTTAAPVRPPFPRAPSFFIPSLAPPFASLPDIHYTSNLFPNV
jgi:hypothetical protein